MNFKDEINLESLINVLVRLVVEFLLLFLIYFWLLGTNTNLQNSWMFFTVSFVLMVSVVPVQVQFELILKYADNWKKYVDNEKSIAQMIEYDETSMFNYASPNIWKSAFQLTLPGSLLGAGSLVVYHYFFKHVIWLEIVVIGFIAISIIVPLVLALNKRCLFPACFYLSNNPDRSVETSGSIDDYFFGHHILPWLPITLLTSGLLTYKMTEETLFSTGSLDVFTTAMYTVSMCYITLLWMWYESKCQAKVEHKMKLFDSESTGKVTSEEFFFLTHGVALGVLILSLAIGYIFFSDGFSSWFAIIYIPIVTMMAGALGNVLGVISVNSDEVETDTDAVDITDEF
ncbi:MAG: putative Mn2+ efflux pump MntP [Alteromonadaceae bacterium]|jgi:putative Mn2+ efflux pump MntP